MESALKDMVFPFTLSCVECSEYKYNWMLYIAVAYIPPTIFYFAIVVLRISVSHGLMVGYVTVSQMVGSHSLIKMYLAIINNSHKNKILFILCGILIFFVLSFLPSAFILTCHLFEFYYWIILS